ncbi:MAG: hypothetical protein AABY13_04575 [Nanoarchaeota archaeon]
MALFTFGKKKEEPRPAQPSGPPVDQVLQMQAQNMTNNQIVEALQRGGYDINTIMDAIAQAEAVSGVQPYPQGIPPGPAPQGFPPMPPPPQQPESGSNIEELAEKVVEEKWQEFQKELVKWGEWRDNVNLRVERLEQGMTDTRADLDNLHKAIVSKIGEYDKNLIDVGTEIKAMEKVFQKVLPTLTENVSELSRVAKTIREGPQQPSMPAKKPTR